MEKTRILVTVKTAPLLSTTYAETVCTAGLREDGRWIRVYPIPYRLLDKTQKFSKFQWIEARVIKDTRDPRPESHKLVGKIKVLRRLDTNNQWEERKKMVLQHVHTNLTALINEARDTSISTSLAVFKPERIIRFHLQKADTKQDYIARKKMLAETLDQKTADMLAEHVPYTFHYTFVDAKGRRSCLQILDWEIYQFCRKLMRKYGKRTALLERHLARKYFDEFKQKREVYFFLGTTKYWHIRRSRNPFLIVGVFYPPKETPEPPE